MSELSARWRQPEMAMTRAQERTRSIEVIPEYAPDKAAMLAGLTYVLGLPLDPTVTVQQSEAHLRACPSCPSCSVGGSDGLCPEGRWYAERVARAAMPDPNGGTR